MPLELTIVEMLKLWQERRRYTTDEMAAVIGVTPQNYSRRLRLNSFSSEEIEKLLEKLNCRIEITQKEKQ